jgi:hypothetical protein
MESMRIKFLFAGLFLLLIQSSVSAQNSVTKKLIGKWEAQDAAKEVGSFEFLDSVNIIMTIPDQPVPPGTYTIDTTKNPMWLDIKIPGGPTLKNLVKFVDANTLKWQAFFDGKRPATFVKETNDNTILLKRKSAVKK